MNKFKDIDCTKCEASDCIVTKYCSIKWKNKINTCKTVSFYKQNQPIVKEETTAMGIYIVHSGNALIISERNNKKRQILRIAKAGEILEHKITNNNLTSPFTAEAFRETLICYIPKETFFQLLKQEPKLTIHLERIYSNKYIGIEKRLNNFILMNAYEKLANAILFVANTFDGEVLFTRKELGELIGISPEQVSRELKIFMENDLITKKEHNKRIVIKDITKLENIVRDYN